MPDVAGALVPVAADLIYRDLRKIRHLEPSRSHTIRTHSSMPHARARAQGIQRKTIRNKLVGQDPFFGVAGCTWSTAEGLLQTPSRRHPDEGIRASAIHRVAC